MIGVLRNTSLDNVGISACEVHINTQITPNVIASRQANIMACRFLEGQKRGEDNIWVVDHWLIGDYQGEDLPYD